MGLQSCKLVPIVRTCEASCSDHCGTDCGIERDSESFGMVGVQAVSAMIDRCPGTDPMGNIFEETLEQLGPLERELMQFSSSSNVLAVRWLLHLGARWDAGDTNNSTCLHVACRAGSIPVVAELLSYPSLLQAVDTARWTPLHIAAFMGRREVVLRLLAAHADPNAVNFSRQTPVDLCFDSGTLDAFRELTEESMEIMAGDTLHDKWRLSSTEDNVGAPLECEHIPFFLPPVAAFHARDRHEELWTIAVLIFNMQPSYGLGFAVAAGLSCSYADALLRLLQRPHVNRAQVGGFLGEALSLSFLTRLSLFDSIELHNTGIISALRNVFRVFQLPEDFQKINRLLLGLAQVWWRKHKREAFDDDDSDTNVASDKAGLALETLAARYEASPPESQSEEVCGSNLKACLASMEALAHFMFSTVLLHWFIHGDGSGKRREFSLQTWTSFNKGLGYGGNDIPKLPQRQIHQIVSKDFIKELVMSVARSDTSHTGEVCWERCAASSLTPIDGPDEGAGLPRSPTRMSCLTSAATIEGWAQQRFIGAQTRHSDISEIPPSRNPSGTAGYGVASDNFLESVYLSGSKMWLSLCGSILFLWSSAGQGSSSTTPHMFIDLVRSRVVRMEGSMMSDRGNASKKPSARPKILSLVGAPEPAQPSYNVFGTDRKAEGLPIPSEPTNDSCAEGDTDVHQSWGTAKAFNDRHETELPLTVVHLLPDGRWQEIHLVRLELWFANESETDDWATRMTDALASASCARRQSSTCFKEKTTSSETPVMFPHSSWLNDTGTMEDHSEAFAGNLSGRFVRASAACKVISLPSSLEV